MARTLRLLVAAWIAAPALAWAQSSLGLIADPIPPELPAPYSDMGCGAPTSRGHIQGTVSSVDAQAGQVTLSSGARALVVRGTPQQVANYKPGQRVNIPYVEYGSTMWIGP